MRTVCIIPARGGSKRVPNKNLQTVGGKPLVLWGIEAAQQARLVDEIFVSTNDREIRGLSLLNGASVIDRPKNLCTAYAQTESAIDHALSTMKEKPDIIVLLQCTTPFKEPGSIDRAIRLLLRKEADSLLFVAPLHEFIWPPRGEPVNYDYRHRVRTQEAIWYYAELGDFIFTYKHFMRTKCRLGGKKIMFGVPSKYNINIDTEWDLKVADLLAGEFPECRK